MLLNVPLTIAPLIVYNLVMFGVLGDATGQGDPWFQPVFTIEMVSGARWTMVLGDLLVGAAMVLLFLEILKATRTGPGSTADHVLSAIVLVVYLLEFVFVAEAAHSTFFVLMLITLLDVAGGVSIMTRGLRRELGLRRRHSR